MNKLDIAKLIDYTNVSPIATSSDIKKLCQEAKKYGFFSVCVTSSRAKLAKSFLKNSSIKLISVVGFPHGTTTSQIKAAEAKQAVENGADEIDMVMNIGAFKEKNYQYVLNEIKMVVKSAKPKSVKVIIETCYLTKNEIKKVCQIVKKSGAVFVKTSTGYGPSGAKEEDIKLMRKTVGPDFGVKASGGIRDLETILKMIKAGANRIGTRTLLK
ncbi:MAG: deoxyribose-phosphate aldolase [Patescibacteria group bacterium]|nr:deoxyribose-phosphate aldolase [Patescibacteria group bacterium]MDD5164343.1 deoxyribose-phosphate aldolase [Patescibacteria group bacterium]MDD5534289.1 deoxyribose-phosphate aldolase [Patescibacteria group bacterium]